MTIQDYQVISVWQYSSYLRSDLCT